MTREEAKEDVLGYVHMEDYDSVCEFIDERYDDFESRTCENCKHWNKTNEIAVSFDCNRWHGSVMTSKDFGCNKWEAMND